jgi:hypothetical protein
MGGDLEVPCLGLSDRLVALLASRLAGPSCDPPDGACADVAAPSRRPRCVLLPGVAVVGAACPLHSTLVRQYKAFRAFTPYYHLPWVPFSQRPDGVPPVWPTPGW